MRFFFFITLLLVPNQKFISLEDIYIGQQHREMRMHYFLSSPEDLWFIFLYLFCI